jgi:predicted Fe-S protein YdhL (DUF1289 family)
MTNDAPTPLDELFPALARSTFRSRFRLRGADLAYLRGRGMDVVASHAREMIAARLAPAEPLKDGKQTPMLGHPVFVAQHATATCCRGCLAKWHRIPKGRPLSDDEQEHVVAALVAWMRAQDENAPADVADSGGGPGGGQMALDLG